MRKKLFISEIAGFVFVSVLGTINHFVYDWSGCSFIVGLFCPVNESVWEHLKLLFFPYLLWSVIQYSLLGRERKILPCKCIGIIAGMMATVSFFYTYTGIIGKNIDALNILSFFIGVFGAFATDYILIKSDKLKSTKAFILSVAAFTAIALAFFLFTVYPPLIPLFRDPINFSYGI